MNPTLLQRLIAAGIPESRARGLLNACWVRVDGEAVSDPDMVIPRAARVVIYEPREVAS